MIAHKPINLKGKSRKDLAADLGIHRHSLTRLIKSAGIEHRRLLTAGEVEAVMKLWTQPPQRY